MLNPQKSTTTTHKPTYQPTNVPDEVSILKPVDVVEIDVSTGHGAPNYKPTFAPSLDLLAPPGMLNSRTLNEYTVRFSGIRFCGCERS